MTKQLLNSLALLLSLSFIFSTQLTIENVDIDAGTLEIHMQNDSPVGGFQFDLSNISVTGASGGSAAGSGFLISTSATTVLGFSLTGGTIPEGDGPLVEVTFDGTPDEILWIVRVRVI